MKNVIYLIAIEKVFDNAIFDNQVKKLLTGLKRTHGDELELTLLVLLPWIELTRRGPYSNFRLYGDQLKELKQELAGQGIELVVKRTLFPSAFFNMKIPGLCYLTLIALPVVWYYVQTRRAQLVHCRYYYATFLALLASRLSFRRLRVIFDIRTILPEQGVVNRIWKMHGLVFRFWKRVEKWMVKEAARVISVAPAMTSWVNRDYPGIKVETIPNFVDLDLFRRSDEQRDLRRRELGVENRTVLTFSGTLGARYPGERMAKCVKTFFEVFGPESFFLVLTSSDEKRVEPLLTQLVANGLESDRHWKVRDVSPENVPEYLSAADWALLVLDDFLTSDTFLPVKFAEYLASGLPILTHPNNAGITDIVRGKTIGGVLDSSKDPGQLAAELKRHKDLMQENCIRTAREEFSLQHFTRRYWKIYDELTAD